MSAKRINIKDLLGYEGKEGLILQGCGGDPQEWIDGINDLLTKQEILLDAAGKDTFILLDPPYKGTENYYQKANFGADEHAMLFEFMNGIHEKYKGECKFIITYNNDPYIRELADKYGFDTFVKERLHNMLQSTKPGEMFEELLIGNYDLLKQAETNQNYLLEQSRQLTLFDFQYDY